MTGHVETEVLIVGAGPAGAAAAAFLGRHGISTLTISRHRGTAHTPRAHIVNQRTMEVMRDAGLEQQCLDAAEPGELLANTFWLRSMAGEELARAWAWGNDPARAGDYRTASPCDIVDLPQSAMEPILVSEATRLGGDVRFGVELETFRQDAAGVEAVLRDRLTGDDLTVRARYMIAADGARSRVVEQLGLPLVGRHDLAVAFNVLCEVDLAAQVRHRHGSLYHVVQPDISSWAPSATFRMVKPWHRWLVAIFLPVHLAERQPTAAEFADRIAQATGVPDLPIDVIDISRWTVNDVHAERYTVGRVICIGDAVHRHPPANALGSNTCVQDAHNVAWKLALVLRGKAHESLLLSIDAERQPVGRQIVERANKSLFHNLRMIDMVGGGTRERLSPEALAAFTDTPDGRAAMRAELDQAAYNGSALGVELTRHYRSNAIIDDGSPPPERLDDPELHYLPSTRPGSSLPHVWLVGRLPGPLRSTLDLAGKGGFHLFSGHGGAAWRQAAAVVAGQFQIDLRVTLIGPGLDIEDPYGDWARLRGVAEEGAVLVRPDLIVAWSSPGLPEDPEATLRNVFASLLGWRPEHDQAPFARAALSVATV